MIGDLDLKEQAYTVYSPLDPHSLEVAQKLDCICMER